MAGGPALDWRMSQLGDRARISQLLVRFYTHTPQQQQQQQSEQTYTKLGCIYQCVAEPDPNPDTNTN